MSLTITYGGVTLANPNEEDGIVIERDVIGTSNRTLDGTLRADIAAEKATITYSTAGLSKDEKSTLRTKYLAVYSTATDLVITNGTTSQTFSVLAVNGWRETVWYDSDSTDYYDITIRFSEV